MSLFLAVRQFYIGAEVLGEETAEKNADGKMKVGNSPPECLERRLRFGTFRLAWPRSSSPRRHRGGRFDVPIRAINQIRASETRAASQVNWRRR